MASKANRRTLFAEDFFFFVTLYPSEPIDLCHLVCAAFFLTRLQPAGCTKQLIKVYAGQPFT